MKKLLKKWSFWAMTIGAGFAIARECMYGDIIGIVWVILAHVSICLGTIQNEYLLEIEKLFGEQEELLNKANTIIHLQADVIKELNDKLENHG